MQDADTGSFLEDYPSRVTPPLASSSEFKMPSLSFSAMEFGTRPKTSQGSSSEMVVGTGVFRADRGSLLQASAQENNDDWSVVIDWCRENREDKEQ